MMRSERGFPRFREQPVEVCTVLALDIFAVLEQRAEREPNPLRREILDLERHERAHPIQRLGDTRHFLKLLAAQPLYEAHHLTGQPLFHAGEPGAQDLEFHRGIGIADPVIQAAALEGVVELTGAVRRQHDDRRFLSDDRSQFGHGYLEFGQHFEQKRFERLVRAPIAPASPQPFTPSALWVHGVHSVMTLKLGTSSARGIA